MKLRLRVQGESEGGNGQSEGENGENDGESEGAPCTTRCYILRYMNRARRRRSFERRRLAWCRQSGGTFPLLVLGRLGQGTQTKSQGSLGRESSAKRQDLARANLRSSRRVYGLRVYSLARPVGRPGPRRVRLASCVAGPASGVAREAMPCS